MTRRPRWYSLLLLLALLVSFIGGGTATRAQSANDGSPGLAGQEIRSALFDAQAALLAGNTADAVAAVASAQGAVDAIASQFTADPAAATALTSALSAAQDAATANDAGALGVASGQAWAALMRGAFHVLSLLIPYLEPAQRGHLHTLAGQYDKS